MPPEPPTTSQVSTPAHEPNTPPPPVVEPLVIKEYSEEEIPDWRSKYLILVDILIFLPIILLSFAFNFCWTRSLEVIIYVIDNVKGIDDVQTIVNLYKPAYLSLVAPIVYVWVYYLLFAFIVIRCRFIYKLNAKIFSWWNGDDDENEN